MENLGHFIMASCLVVVLAIYLPHYAVIDDQSKMLFFGALVFFSAVLTPDIDLKLPYVKHRGVTHQPLWIAFMALVAWLLTDALLIVAGRADLTGFAPFVWLGFVVGWYLHMLVDYAYDRLRQVTWLLLAVAMAAAWWLAR